MKERTADKNSGGSFFSFCRLPRATGQFLGRMRGVKDVRVREKEGEKGINR